VIEILAAYGPRPCATEPGLYFARDQASIDKAIAICTSCIARMACLNGALALKIKCGVWGGKWLGPTVDAESIQPGEVSTTRPPGRPRVKLGPLPVLDLPEPDPMELATFAHLATDTPGYVPSTAPPAGIPLNDDRIAAILVPLARAGGQGREPDCRQLAAALGLSPKSASGLVQMADAARLIERPRRGNRTLTTLGLRWLLANRRDQLSQAA
jgi:hypothetical protein